jgi:glycosyltransferase involved in cell wall biosynthesis
VIEHGVKLLHPARYEGTLATGLVVVNNIDRRGRRLGFDIYQDVAEHVPLELVGMGSERCGGSGEVSNASLPGRMAAHRFFFNPIRYTSLGLAVIEAMMVGTPVVALATTEIVSVIRNGETGFFDTRVEKLVEAMQRLLAAPDEAHLVGAAGRRSARERFAIERFVRDWDGALRRVTS